QRLGWPGAATDQHIDPIHLRGPVGHRREILDSILSSVGETEGRHHNIELSSRGAAESLLELARSLGLVAMMTTTEAGRYRLCIDILQHLTDMSDHSAQPDNGRWLEIVAVTPASPVPSRCLKIEDPEHRYMTGGFIPTHYSILLQSIISGALVRGWELVIADAVKGGVDFAPFKPYVRDNGWGCESLEEAVTALDLAYHEGLRRKQL